MPIDRYIHSKGAIIFYREWVLSVCGTEFFGMLKGGGQFFFSGPEGDQNFLRVIERGTKIFSQFFCAFGTIPS